MSDVRVTLSGWWDAAVLFSADAEELILTLSETLWLYPLVSAVAFIDAFFPVVPSESAVIAAASAWAHGGAGWLEISNPWLPAIWIAAAAGAWCGDQVTYFVGSRIDVRRLRVFRSERGRATLDWAEHALERRGTAFIIAARFVPLGRVAVNLTAGALRFPHRRFMGVDAIAVMVWATWGVALGTFAGRVFHDNLLLSIVVGVVGGVVLGMLVDKVIERLGMAPPQLPDLAGDIEESLEEHGR